MAPMTMEQLLETVKQAGGGSGSGSCSPLDRLQDLLGSDAVLVEVPWGHSPEVVEGRVVELVNALKGCGVDVHSDVQVWRREVWTCRRGD